MLRLISVEHTAGQLWVTEEKHVRILKSSLTWLSSGLFNWLRSLSATDLWSAQYTAQYTFRSVATGDVAAAGSAWTEGVAGAASAPVSARRAPVKRVLQ